MKALPTQTDCLIIGAGYAGLAAAKTLSEASKDFLVLEARSRIGGRIWSETLPNGVTVDLGGQWVGPGQSHFLRAIEANKIATFPTWDSGKNILHFDKITKTYTGTIPNAGLFAILQLGWVMWKMDRMAASLRKTPFLQHSKSSQWDNCSLQDWINKNLTNPVAKKLFSIGMETVMACPPEEQSLLHALEYVRSGENLDRLLGVTGGAQQTRFPTGAQTLANIWANSLGENIFTGTPVLAISKSGNYLMAETPKGTIRAEKIILAIPPTQAGKIPISPPISLEKSELWKGFTMGRVIKYHVFYSQPWWREKGLSGQSVSDLDPINVTFDNSPLSGNPGSLVGFIEAAHADKWGHATEQERKNMVLDRLSRIFGSPATDAIFYIDKVWQKEAWIEGGYVASMRPGVLSKFGGWLQKPEGNLHFAGTETATHWNGYIDGALESGFRAAAEVLKA